MNWLKMEKNLPIDLQDGDGYSDSFLKSKILNSFIKQKYLKRFSKKERGKAIIKVRKGRK